MFFNYRQVMNRQTLKYKKRVLAKDHPEAFVSINNLGISFLHHGKYVEAETLYRQTLKIKQRVFKNDHPHTFKSIVNVANPLREQSKYSKAESIYRQTLQLQMGGVREGPPKHACEHKQSRRLASSAGQVRRGRGNTETGGWKIGTDYPTYRTL